MHVSPEQRIQVGTRFGVPRTQRAFVYVPAGVTEVTGTVETGEPEIRIALQDVVQ